MNRLFRILFIAISFCFLSTILNAQQFMLQGWYWDYPKTPNGHNWSDTLEGKAQSLADAGFTHVWLPPLSRASFGSGSNGYDPKDLYDLGEFGLGATGFGTRTQVDAVIAAFDNVGIKSVADVVYNHRDGGSPENNPAVEGWIENLSYNDVQNNNNNPFPSDRYRVILPIGGSTGRGAGTYYIKISSASQHPNFHGNQFKFYAQTNAQGFKNLPAVNEDENNNGNGNGGGDCGQGFNTIELGVDFFANVDGSGCTVDELALTIAANEFNAIGDTVFISLTNVESAYSDHRIYGIYYAPIGGGGSDVVNDLIYQTFTDFTNMPSNATYPNSMNYLNFRPNGNSTTLNGDFETMLFFYDYDQFQQSTKDALFDWTDWLWSNVGIRGLRMDAVKHFPAEFVGDLLDDMHDNGRNPDMVVGEFFDGNPSLLKGWVDGVYANMDEDTKAAITPRIFDFTLRQALKDASDALGNDVRNIFNESMVDKVSASPFTTVTFVSNHDFREENQIVQNDPILGYAYILTNNQIGTPTIFYYDYYNRGLKNQIDALMGIHKSYIFGASARDYLSRFGTPYAQNFASGYPNTTLVYQLYNTPSGKEVIVAINYAGEPLRLTQVINTGINLQNGDQLVELTGNAATTTTDVSNNSIYIDIPARSYAVWVEGDGESVLPAVTTNSIVDNVHTSTLSDAGGIVSVEIMASANVEMQLESSSISNNQKRIFAAETSLEFVATAIGANAFVKMLIIDASGNQKVHFIQIF